MIAPIRPRVTVEAICVAIADAQPRTPVDDNLQAALEYGLLTHVTWDYAGLRHVVTLSLPAALGDIKLATAYLEQPPEVIAAVAALATRVAALAIRIREIAGDTAGQTSSHTRKSDR